MTDDRPAVDREAVLDICRRYMGIERHAQHLVADLLDPRAELLRDAADVERDALAAVEALHFPKGHRITGEPLCDGCWTGGEYPCPTAQAVAGDTSALDAVKAAERERFTPVAREVDAAARKWDGEDGETAQAVAMLLHTIAAELRARLAREDPRFNDPATDGALDARMETEGDR